MAPYAPHFSEECYSFLDKGSVHKTTWPAPIARDQGSLDEGEMLVKLVSELRRYKHENGMALNAPMGKISVFSPLPMDDSGDMARTLNAEVNWRSGTAKLEKVLTGVQFNMGVIGPLFRKDAKAFMDAISSLPAELQENPPESVMIGSAEVKIPENSFTLQYSYMVEGEKVDLITVGDIIVTIRKTS
jgi:valyl-tRNA synthetase